LISLQALGLSAQEAIRYYLALKMADQGLLSAPNAAVGAPFVIGGGTLGTFPLQIGVGSPPQANPPDALPPNSPWGPPSTDREG
jgi:hypothetical protein